MCPIVDGQAVNASNSNAAWLDAQTDDTAVGVIGLANTAPASGTAVTNLQREQNSHASFTGNTINSSATSLPSWNNNDVGASTDPLKTRADALTQKFNNGSGHTHDGSTGSGGPIVAASLSSVRLHGYVQQGTDLTAVTGTSTVVTTQMSGKTNSTGITVKGVVVTAPNNKVVIRQAGGANSDDVYKDGSGNIVYARITWAASVWTLSYYVDLSGTETAYSFSSSNVRWYYQELFNPITDAPVFSEFATIPSDNVTADVIVATTSAQGKVQLNNTTSTAIAATGTIGTTNATVANADHTHAGVSSVAKSGSTALLGAVTFTGSNGTTATQSSQNIDFSSPALSSTTPTDIASTGAVGTGTTTARADHTHRGVLSVSDGTTPIYGAATISGSGGTSTSVTGQTMTVSSPALSSTTPEDISGTAAIGSGTTSAKADHTHKGLFSINKTGSTALNGAVTLTAGSNVTLTQSGQDITIASTSSGGGGGGSLQWVEDSNSPPIADVQNSDRVYLYTAGASQNLYALIRVPTSYTAGNPINMKLTYYSPDSSGTALLTTVATLIRTGTDSITSTTNQRTSTNTAVTLTSGNRLLSVTLDVSSGSGQINAVAISAGDMIRVALSRGTDTSTSDIRALVYGAEVTFT